MLGASTGTAEEFHGRCLSNVDVLDASARSYASTGDVVSAIACAWAADVCTIQAVSWERIVIASRAPLRQFFSAAQALTSAIAENSPEAESTGSARDLVQSVRDGAMGAFTDELAEAIAARWHSIDYLSTLAAPTHEQILASVEQRLGGLTAARFISERRRIARDLMLQAHGQRMQNDLTGSINSAYESDYRSLESYLVESALAANDTGMFTVISRTDLVSHAVSDIPGLPDDFLRAVGVIRTAMVRALGEADGGRLQKTFVDPQHA